MAKIAPVIIPRESVNDETVTLVSWLVGNGQRVEKDQAIASVESSKAVMDIHAPTAGFVQSRLRPGDEIGVGAILCLIADEATAGVPLEPIGTPVDNNAEAGGPFLNSPPAGELTRPPAELDRKRGQGHDSHPAHARLDESKAAGSCLDRGTDVKGARFSAKAGDLLERHHLSPEQFEGHGLVRASDIREHLNSNLPKPHELPHDSADAPFDRSSMPQPAVSTDVLVRTEKLSKRKQTEVRYLAWAQQNTFTSAVSVMVPTRGFRA